MTATYKASSNQGCYVFANGKSALWEVEPGGWVKVAEELLIEMCQQVDELQQIKALSTGGE